MAMTTITYTKGNNFLSEVSTPYLVKEGADGQRSTRPYKDSILPGTVQGKKFRFDHRKNRYDLDIEQDELNKLVEEMGLFDEEGNKITECHLGNEGDKFINHEEMKLYFESGRASVDPDTPKGKLWTMYAKGKDPDFRLKGSKDDLVGMKSASARFTITENKSLEVAEEEEILDEEIKARKLMAASDLQKKAQLLRALGVEVKRTDLDETTVDRGLTKKVFKQRDDEVYPGMTNMKYFIYLGEKDDETLYLMSLVKEARDLRIIKRKPQQGGGHKYFYNKTLLANSYDGILKFLSDEDNEDILNKIEKSVEDRG